MREEIKNFAKNNYEEFIKSILSLELNIDDEKSLDCLYEYYMENDGIRLLSDEFYDMVKK